jgi:hypothetical protein
MFSTANANWIFQRIGFDSKTLGLQNLNNYDITWTHLPDFLNLKANQTLDAIHRFMRPKVDTKSIFKILIKRRKPN